MPATTITPTFTPDPEGKYSAYIKELSRKYSNLSKLVIEEPPSHLRSSPEPDEDRIRWLRERVLEAWGNADGNPADGKWGFVTQLLRMGVSSGRNGRWIGARTDIKSPDKPEGEPGWLNTSSEAEWDEWEKKFNQDRTLKDRVENWKRNVELYQNEVGAARQVYTTDLPDSHALEQPKESGSRKPSDATGSTAKPGAAVSLDPLTNSAPFGFNVVKRSSASNEKAAASGKQKPPKDSGPSQSHSEATSNQCHPSDSFGMDKSQYSNSDPSLLPPSFAESQLLTSTPKQLAKSNTLAGQSSSPLPPLSSSPRLHDTRALLARSSSLSFPKVTKAQGLKQNLARRQDETSSSLPAIPSPMRNTTSHDSEPYLNANKKRSLVDPTNAVHEPDTRQVKKAKLTTSLDNAPPVDLVVSPIRPQPAPGGQPHSGVPTLTELLASAKKTKKKRLASTSKPANSEKDQRPSIQERPEPIAGNAIRNAEKFDVNSMLASPAKPLSAISVPDRDDFVMGGSMVRSIEFDPNLSFRPVATSTQVQKPPNPSPSAPNDTTQPEENRTGGNAADSWESIYAPRPGAVRPIALSSSPDKPPELSGSSLENNSLQSSSFPKPSFPMYNSQFESAVAMQVDLADKLLEKDIEFGSWPKDPFVTRKTKRVRDPDDDSDEDGNSVDSPSSSPGFNLSGNAVMKEGSGEDDSSYGYGKAFECDQSF